MKRAVFAVLVWLLMNASLVFAASREAQWKEVEEAVAKGLPKTAIEKLDPIVQGALKDKAWGEATKAIARRIVLEGNIQGNKPEEKIARLEAELAKAPKEIVPLLDTILANWYWHYFQNNRWRFMQRTQTAQAPGKDFTTWDLARLFAEIDKQFQKALAAADTLKQTPVATLNDLLLKGTFPDTYRPTLYDFVAHEALKFYASGEQAATKAEDAFELTVDDIMPGLASPFADTERFIAGERVNVRLAAEQREKLQAMRASPTGKAYFLYRDLLVFHARDDDKTAFLDADLARLVWAHNTSTGEDKATRYKAALNAFVDKWADHEVSAMALHYWARVSQQVDENWVEARDLALRGANAHRDSPGGRLCQNLVSEIESKEYTITTERVWNAPWPKILAQYRDLTNLHFRAVAYDWNLFLDRRRNRPESLNDNERRELLAKAATLEWSVSLPLTADYKQRTEELSAPETLKPGFYFLIASHKADFSENDNQITFTDVWVSELALVVRPREGNVEGFVLEANSGEPVNGAEVAAWYLDNQGSRIALAPVRTDESGFFSVDSRQNRGVLLRVRHNGRELASQQEYWSYDLSRPSANTRTIFFTDRALYRPGQTIQYKGICLRVDTGKNNYDAIGGQRVTVTFADPNNKEIARQEHRCNDYGSFSGSFTAPRDRVMGQMRVYVISGPNGQAGFNVEEYKRPKFQVTLEAPKTAAKLNEQVTLQGKAESYTGAAIDGARVKWRVVREVRWPYWWGWYYSWRMRSVSASQEIAHGTAASETDGTYRIEFFAKPDPKVSETDEASFIFSIYSDVTDSTGETRSAQRSINVGFTALQATLTAADWQTEDKAVDMQIGTTTLDSEPQVAEGIVKVYRLKEPATVHRAYMGEISSYRPGPTPENPDLSDPNWWELGGIVEEKGFTSDTNGVAKLSAKLGVGVYRAILETQDRFGKKVTARQQIRVVRPDDTKLAIKIPQLLAAPEWSLEPGAEFTALWGTGYDTGRAFVEIEHRHQMIQRFWTRPGQTQQQIKQAVTEAMRGGFTLHVTQVRENRAYLESRHVDVPWSNKDLDIKWQHFTSKLGPGQKETWTAVVQIRNPKSEIRSAERAVAEMVATLYDQSLDQFMPLHWPNQFAVFYQDQSSASFAFENRPINFQWLRGQWVRRFENVALQYREFPADLVANLWGYQAVRSRMGGMVPQKAAPLDAVAMNAPAVASAAAEHAFFAGAELKRAEGVGGAADKAPSKGPDLAQVTARKNLSETAFFFPHLVSDSNGVVRMTFTMPEALTTWRFLGFAHDKNLRSGYLEGKTVTSKDLMVQPNPPRFVREGDLLEFTVKVSNQSTNRQVGKVRLTFNNALSGESADRALELRAVGGLPLTRANQESKPELAFDIPAKESRSFSWRIKIPDDAPFLTYKTVGATDTVSDGEEGFLPVLSRYLFITESLPLPIRGPATKKFEFEKLLKSGRSKTLRHQNFTVQMVSNPSWYAVLALPYLMEFPHECTEQTFNRLYANALARNIANSDPKIRRVFDQWKGLPALDSPMEKNQELKAVLIEETPWLRQAQDESQARRNVGILFDENRLNSETERTLQKLMEMQLPDGSWPWFPGGRGNDYITLYITTGFGRLRHLGADINVEPAIRSLQRLDNWMQEHFEEIQKRTKPEDYVPSATDALYLYGRSFFLKDRPVDPQHQKASDFFLARSRDHWLKVADRQSQGHLAIALKRWGGEPNVATSRDIMKSIKERSVTNEEMGMFWRETELSWWWYRAPIETQALMIEAFDEVMGDRQAVEECRVWLLKQKQTQDWKTTKATADAVYGLLLRGKDILASDKLVEVTVGGIPVFPSPSPQPSPSGRGSSSSPHPDKPNALPPSAAANVSPSPRGEGRGEGKGRDEMTPRVEAGTGFYQRRFAASEIKPKLGEITVRKMDEGVAWGSVHWQYLEDMSKVTPYEGTPLKLKKTLFTKVHTKKGPVLESVNGPLSVGDELVVRIELRVDRDMEYIHLKDQRGSGTEPVNVISHYKYQDGLAYYESTRDTASHFFIDYLPKGTYVFEYSTRVQLRGEYQTGIAEIQCMYAPEFNSHSESIPLTVK